MPYAPSMVTRTIKAWQWRGNLDARGKWGTCRELALEPRPAFASSLYCWPQKDLPARPQEIPPLNHSVRGEVVHLNHPDWGWIKVRGQSFNFYLTDFLSHGEPIHSLQASHPPEATSHFCSSCFRGLCLPEMSVPLTSSPGPTACPGVEWQSPSMEHLPASSTRTLCPLENRTLGSWPQAYKLLSP